MEVLCCQLNAILEYLDGIARLPIADCLRTRHNILRPTGDKPQAKQVEAQGMDVRERKGKMQVHRYMYDAGDTCRSSSYHLNAIDPLPFLEKKKKPNNKTECLMADGVVKDSATLQLF